MNCVVLVGNLTRDPELRYSTGANQTAVCRFGIAVNDGFGDRQETNFINIVVFGKQAENCEKYLAKGRKVAVNGRIQTGSYEKDGRKIYTTDVVASRVEFLSSGSQSGESGGQHSFGNAAPSESAGGEPMDVPGFQAIDEDDIPF